MSKVVSIFWDLDNTYWTMSDYYGGLTDPLVKVVDKIWDLYKEDTVRIFRAYADYEKIRNVQTEIQKRRVTPKHVFSSNPGSENRKNAGDIELSLDALETVLKRQEVTHYVIISADKDMIPLMNRLKFYGKHVHLVYLEAAIAEDKLILSFADSATSIESMLGIEVATQDELSAEELDKLVPDTVQIVKDFYTRNAGKPNMYLGQKLFVNELIQKKHIAGKVASKLLEHCLTNNHLDLIEQTGTPYKKVVSK
ncbi:MAG: NYN domain-containing protein [Carboxydocellales bacterium]